MRGAPGFQYECDGSGMAARAGASAATGDTERRRRIGTGFALLTAALTLVVSACSDGHTDVRSVSA